MKPGKKPLELRDYQLEDKPELEQLILHSLADPDLRRQAVFAEAQSEPRENRSVVAVSGHIIGFGSYYQNRLHYHPSDFRLYIVVAPQVRRRGLGRKLHHKLTSHLTPQVVRLRSLTLRDDAGSAFAEALGYHPLLRSYSPSLNVAAVTPEVYAPALKALEAEGYRFTTLAQLDGQTGHILKLCLEAYADTHTYSPPSPSENWQDIFLGNYLEEAFFIAVKNGEPVGFSSLQPGRNKQEMESMWDGVARSERALAFPLRLALKLHEVAYAKRNTVERLCWEVDSVDSVGMRLMSTLPFDVPGVHQIWSREVYPSQA